MKQSEQIDALAKALAAAQAEMQNAPLTKVNPHFKSKYADLPTIRDAVIPTFAKHKLAVVQTFDTDESGNHHVVTTLMHESGQWIQGSCPVKADKPGPQPFGAGATYARRYSLAAIAGISAEEDDDANAAQGNGAGKKTDSAKKPAVFVPNQPGLIPVPTTPNEDANWHAWSAKFKDVIDGAATLEILNAWMEANKPALQGLRKYSEPAHGYLNTRANNRRGMFSQAPAEDAA